MCQSLPASSLGPHSVSLCLQLCTCNSTCKQLEQLEAPVLPCTTAHHSTPACPQQGLQKLQQAYCTQFMLMLLCTWCVCWIGGSGGVVQAQWWCVAAPDVQQHACVPLITCHQVTTTLTLLGSNTYMPDTALPRHLQHCLLQQLPPPNPRIKPHHYRPSQEIQASWPKLAGVQLQ